MNAPAPFPSLAREPRRAWRTRAVLDTAPRDAKPGVRYVFAVGPVPLAGGARSLLFAFRDGRTEPLERVPGSDVVLAPELDPGASPLPAQVLEARALAAMELAWAAALRAEIAPELVLRVLRTAAGLHAAAPWERMRGQGGTIDIDGRPAWDVIPARFPCGCAGINVFPAGTLDRIRGLPRRKQVRRLAADVLALAVGDEPAFAVEPLQAAGFPVVPALTAVRGGVPHRLTEEDVERLEIVARVLAQGEGWIPPGRWLPGRP